MAVKSSSRQKRLTAALLVGALILVAVVLHAPVTDWLEGRRICEQLHAGEGDEQFFNFTDTTKRRFGPRLSPGSYRLTLTSDCYSGECSFVVPDVPKPSLDHPQYSRIECRGQQLGIWIRGWQIGGFHAPAVLHGRRILFRVQRDGRPFWHGTPGRDCPLRGFCVEPEVPLE